jgi:hypothetical protein
MYNFAKLLTEEPEKLERIGILFIKLLVTLLVGSQLCGFNMSISDFIENPIPEGYTLSECIIFGLSLVFIWYFLWSTAAELGMEGLTRLLAKIGNEKKMTIDILRLLNVVKKSGGNIYPAKNIVIFNQMLQAYDAEDQQYINNGKSRLRQYLVVLMGIYFTLLFSKDVIIPTALHLICILMLLNFIVVNALAHKIHNYFEDNIDELRKQYSVLAYVQTIMNGIKQIHTIETNYEIDGPRARIWLKKKASGGDLPQSLKIYPIFHWNDTLLKQVIRDEIIVRRNRNTDKPHHYDIVICNVAPNPEDTKVIEAQPGFAFLHCENEEQVYRNFELFLYQASRINKVNRRAALQTPTA